MQRASRMALWKGDAGDCTVLDLRITPDTGRWFLLQVDPVPGTEATVDWGDGSPPETVPAVQDPAVEHTFPAERNYRVRVRGGDCIGFARMDWEREHAPYMDALLSLDDRSGVLRDLRSGAFQHARNLVSVRAPGATGVGQGVFRGLAGLRRVELPRARYFYDDAFRGCSAIETLSFEGAGTMWNYVFRDCASLRELRLGNVDQISDGCFAECPSLRDVFVSNRTVDQLMQRADEGNVASGYGARFPYGAEPGTRFHCVDGTVLGDGTVI